MEDKEKIIGCIYYGVCRDTEHCDRWGNLNIEASHTNIICHRGEYHRHTLSSKIHKKSVCKSCMTQEVFDKVFGSQNSEYQIRTQ